MAILFRISWRSNTIAFCSKECLERKNYRTNVEWSCTLIWEKEQSPWTCSYAERLPRSARSKRKNCWIFSGVRWKVKLKGTSGHVEISECTVQTGIGAMDNVGFRITGKNNAHISYGFNWMTIFFDKCFWVTWNWLFLLKHWSNNQLKLLYIQY